MRVFGDTTIAAAVSTADPDHLGANAWLFIAIADPSTEHTNPLSNVIATADFYQHGIPTATDIEHAVRDLSAAGLARATGTSLALTERGQEMWQQISAAGPVHRHFNLAEQALRDISCVATAPGWSLDERTWEDAFAIYSPQFRLELKRRRDKGA
jgi:hypothetical protein